MDGRTVYLLPSDLHASATARDHLRRAGTDWPDDLLDTVLLTTTELVSNAVRHGSGQVTLVLSTADQTLRIEVQDHGDLVPGHLLGQDDPGREVRSDDGLGPSSRVPRHDGPDDCRAGAEGGRGLSIVGALATRWGVSQDPQRAGITVWLELELDP